MSKAYDTYRTVCKDVFHGGYPYDEVAKCAFCESGISRRDFGDSGVAIDSIGDVTNYFHLDCCPCITDQKQLKGNWDDLTVYSKEDSYVGSLVRCPFCFRIYDDNGEEVAC